MKVTNDMKTVKKGAILVMRVTGIESGVEMPEPDIAKFGDKALRLYWDLKSPKTAGGDVTAVYTVLDDGLYGEGSRAIRELVVKTGRGNVWLFPIEDLSKGHFEYEVTMKKEKAVIKITADVELYESRAAFKAAAQGKEEKAVKAPKKALKPKKEENASADGVEA